MRNLTIVCAFCRDDGEMKNYHHPACIFETFKKARPSTKVNIAKGTTDPRVEFILPK